MTTQKAKTTKAPSGEVAELQGLYGPFQFGELLLQKLWLRGEFDQLHARTESGEPVRVLHPGSWNRLSGPDFRGARLVIGERELRGDVELHFRVEAWNQHGHQRDPAYDNVVLHVVLFPPDASSPDAKTSDGRILPVLSLVGLLWHDLEEYAADDALAALSGVDATPLVEELLALSAEGRTELLAGSMQKRWEQKVYFARLRVERLGWEEACHQTTLEILGYRSNRAPMLRIAGLFPYKSWREKPPTAEKLFSSVEGWWSRRGVRPANHPRTRIDQYIKWMQLAADWPARLRRVNLPAEPAGNENLPVGALRRRVRMPDFKKVLTERICAGVLSGNRLDTWICNLALPFRAVLNTRDEPVLGRLWDAWYPGDAPVELLDASKRIRGDRSREPNSNGSIQGLLALHFDREAR